MPATDRGRVVPNLIEASCRSTTTRLTREIAVELHGELTETARCRSWSDRGKCSVKAAAAGDLARLNVGRRDHLSFKDGRVERLLHLCRRPIKHMSAWSGFENDSSRPR